jgi:nitroreductase
MSEVLNNIKTRRSVRNFKEEQLTGEQLDHIITAGLYAPSSCNNQYWQFTVVQGVEKLELLQSAISKAIGVTNYHRFYNAPTLIIVSTPREYELGAFDSSVALENIFLEAHELGIGSVWINQLIGNSDHPEVRKVLQLLKVPDNHVAWGSAALGFASVVVTNDRENKGVVVYA